MYLGSGVLSSAAHAATTRNPRQSALGASGSINAAVAYSICANPFMLIIVLAEFFPLPLPAFLYGGIYIGRDVAAMLGRELTLPFGLGGSGGVAHAAHVGGAAVGMAIFLASRGRLRR